MNSLRILSLLPAATEIVYLLGLEKYLVGVSHECDYPPEVKTEVKKKPKVTFSEVSNSMSSKEIDNRVEKIGHRGPGVFHIKEEVFKKLRPNLILTQELCEVCAVTPSVILRSEGGPSKRDKDLKIISLEPESVEDILDNIRVVGEFGGKEKEAIRVIRGLKKRIENCKLRIVNSTKSKVCVVEWLDPLMVAGHWVPEMIEIAGGKNLLTKRGERSKKVTLGQIKSAQPDILVISPCGFDIDRIFREKFIIDNLQCTIKKAKVFLIDGNAYVTRPGPRIIDGIEILAEILHPELFQKKHTKKDWGILNI